MPDQREMTGEIQEETGGRKSGTVALVGRPNAGKSTLMNQLLEEKLAIVSDKPQTTRHRIVGILSGDRGQMVFFDTPGVHKPLHRLNRQMVRYAMDSLNDADVVCLLVDASQSFGAGDAYMLEVIAKASEPRILVLNKIDRLRDKAQLLPLIDRYAKTGLFAEIVPLSARSGDGTGRLLELLWERLPAGEPMFDSELLTTHPERFLVAERIREKVLELTSDELPFSTAVKIERWEDEEERPLTRIYATILVDRHGQKKIVVGNQGKMIKAIGTAARLDLEEYLGRRIFLELYVRVEEGWREDRAVLASLDRDVEVEMRDAAPDLGDLEGDLDRGVEEDLE